MEEGGGTKNPRETSSRRDLEGGAFTPARVSTTGGRRLRTLNFTAFASSPVAERDVTALSFFFFSNDTSATLSSRQLFFFLFFSFLFFLSFHHVYLYVYSATCVHVLFEIHAYTHLRNELYIKIPFQDSVEPCVIRFCTRGWSCLEIKRRRE